VRLGILVLIGLLLSGTAYAETTRVALILGNNIGDADDERLRFAETDAVKVAEVLRDLGGFRSEDTTLLLGGDAGAARRALIGANDRIRSTVSAGTEVLFLIYYSGHADARGLHLGNTTLEISEIEQFVRGSPATMRLLILDSCRSGSVTRVKGGMLGPPLEIRVDERLAGEGVVFLTASAANENAQESDEIRGSFFTHHLVSGLLGAADADGNSQVSVEEAYRYSYENTLRSSSRTLGGLQHPTFRYEVGGRGAIVLSRFAASGRGRALLTLPPGHTFLLFAGDASGPVIAEVGAADRQRQVSVRAGRYFIRGRATDHLLEGTVDVRDGQRLAISDGALTRVAYARLVRKGGGLLRLVHGPLAGYRLRTPLAAGASACHGVVAGWSFDMARFSITPRLSACRGEFANQILRATEYEVAAGARLAHAWDLPWLTIDVGLELGWAVLRQTYATSREAPDNLTAAGRSGLGLAASRDIGGAWYASVELAGEMYLFEGEKRTGQELETALETPFVGALLVGIGTRLALP
jgi:hypothetical protein